MASASPSKAPSWQHPFVDVFRAIPDEAKRRRGDAARVLDSEIGKMVLRVRGRISSKNFVLIGGSDARATNPVGMGLTGRFMYVELKPLVSASLAIAPFVIHIDVVTVEGNIVRLSTSNQLYRRASATPLAIKLPLALSATPRWTVAAFDIVALLRKHCPRAGRREGSKPSAATSHRFRCVRSIKICSSVCVRNVFTSSFPYTPSTLPSAMMLPLRAATVAQTFDAQWQSTYDWVWLPSAPPAIAATSVAVATATHPLPPSPPPGPYSADRGSPALVTPLRRPSPPTHAARRSTPASATPTASPPQRAPAALHLHDIVGFSGGQRVGGEGDAFEDGGAELRAPLNEASTAPTPGCLWSVDGSELIYASSSTIVALRIGTEGDAVPALSGGPAETQRQRFFVGHTAAISVLALSHDGAVLASAQVGVYPVIRLWDFNASRSVLGGACVALVTAHAQPLVALTFSRLASDAECRLAAAGRTEKGRCQLLLWDVGPVWAACRAARESGADSTRRGRSKVRLVARQTSDIDVQKLRFCPFDNARLASCGADSVRLWRVARGKLPSTPFRLKGAPRSPCCFAASTRSAEHQRGVLVLQRSALTHFASLSAIFFSPSTQFSARASSPPPGMGGGVVFTDLAFESTYGGQQLVPYGSGAEVRPRNDASLLRRLFVVTNVGTLLQFNYDTLDFQCVYRLHDGAITSIAVNEGFCVTASTDQFLRVWPLDFSDYWLEVRAHTTLAVGGRPRACSAPRRAHSRAVLPSTAHSPASRDVAQAHHEGAVTCIDISYDGLRIASGCATASIGVLNVASHDYSTVLRAHSSKVILCYGPYM